jgi:N-acetylglucosaminyldiphosphoundecaprenol N-acetyl-beta-D-mannosaminyltransferase
MGASTCEESASWRIGAPGAGFRSTPSRRYTALPFEVGVIDVKPASNLEPDPVAFAGSDEFATRTPNRLFGIAFDLIDAEELRRWTRAALLGEERGRRIAFSNPEFVIETLGNSSLREYLNTCELNVIDGTGLLLAFRYVHGLCPPERLTGTNYVALLAEEVRATGSRLFLFGGRPGVATRARARLEALYPGLTVCGCRDGFDGASDVLEAIRAAKPDALMVCLGNPKQEQWIKANAPALPLKLVFGNGGALDFWSGDVPTAPAVIQRAGLEWLFRLVTNFSGARLRRQLRLAEFVRMTVRERRASRT